jgi:UDP-N-acetylglucosamine 1-carboxyvinyltransferase
MTGRRGSDSQIVINGGRLLSGSVAIGGAKNSVLKLMAACLLTEGRFELRNVPDIADVSVMAELLGCLGVQSRQVGPSGVWELTTGGCEAPEAPFRLAERIRASIVVLGPLLARCGRASVALPGGDDFGPRPIDMHLSGLEALGARFELRHGAVHGFAPDGLRGAEVTLQFPSVGATENIVLAAVGARGVTVLDNAAREPEIVDLCQFLVAMGADIEGTGSSKLVVHGVALDSLRGVAHNVVSDRVEGATYLACCAAAGGEIEVRGARAEHMEMLLVKLSDMGVAITVGENSVSVKAPDRLRSVDVATLPYPGVATDYKPLLTTLLAIADGVGIVTENLFAGRFRYVDELLRMGANIRTDAHHAVVRGVPRLSGAPVTAHDIRAGAALVVAALAADGTTTIRGARHVDRGYAGLVEKLAALGADATRD